MRGTNSSDAEIAAAIVERAGRERRAGRVSGAEAADIAGSAGGADNTGGATTTSAGAITCADGAGCCELVTAGAGLIKYTAGATRAATAAAIVRYRKLFVAAAPGLVRRAVS